LPITKPPFHVDDLIDYTKNLESETDHLALKLTEMHNLSKR